MGALGGNAPLLLAFNTDAARRPQRTLRQDVALSLLIRSQPNPTRLPVYSLRVQQMLSAFNNAGAQRVRDVKATLGWSFQATNALVQYLKRRGLIAKSREAFDAPYVLTAMGALTLAEMTSPAQMTSGYAPGTTNIASPVGKRPPRQAERSRHQKAKRPTIVKPPRLPVNSQRIRAALTVLSRAGALRIKDISDNLRLPHQTINSLMQYSKRKDLVQKTGAGMGAPYALTPPGRAILAEMAQSRAA